jgi:hypothetical protein
MVSLPIGVDFREHLTEAVSGCDISDEIRRNKGDGSN